MKDFATDRSKHDLKSSRCRRCHSVWKNIKRKERKNDPHARFLSLGHSARNRKHEYSITEEYFKIFFNKECAYCGGDSRGGIDRIDSSKGYIEDNITSCCEVCNRMKMDHNIDFFKDQIRKVYNHLNLG